MNFNRKLTNKDLKNLKDDGLVILPNFIRETNLTKMNQEIKPWLKRISFNNNFSYFLYNTTNTINKCFENV